MNLTADELLNASTVAIVASNESKPWLTFHYFFLLSVIICITCAVFGNGLVILSWCLDQSIRTPSNALLVSLALPDFLVGIISIPFLAMYELFGTWIFGESVCNFWLVMLWTAGFVSSFHLVLIAIDRYRILMEGVQYLNRQTLNSVILPVLLVWFSSLSITLPMMIDWKETGDYHFKNATNPVEQQWVCRSKTSTLRVVYTNFTVVLIPGILMVTIYAKIFAELKRRFRKKLNKTGESVDASKTSQSMEESTVSATRNDAGGNHHNANGLQNENSGEPGLSFQYGPELNRLNERKRLEYMKKEKRAAKTLGFLIAAFILCWTPYLTVSFLRVTKLADKQVLGRTIPLISALFGWFNSCVNPMIYAKRNHDFQRAFKRTIRIISCGVFCKR